MGGFPSPIRDGPIEAGSSEVVLIVAVQKGFSVANQGTAPLKREGAHADF